jgi:plasmid maintenance system antidote protein VapI
MSNRPSTELLRVLREAAKTRGWNTAALAKAAELPRGEMKRVLAGTSPLTVDTFASLAAALEVGANELARLMSASDSDDEGTPKLQPIGHKEIQALPPIDPLGEHADQMLRLGFALGCDMTLLLATDQLEESGLPTSTLEQFPKRLPVRLDAAFHRHNDPRFLPDGIQLTLSFDALYTIVIPWSAVLQVAMLPVHAGTPTVDPEPPSGKATHLRLLD